MNIRELLPSFLRRADPDETLQKQAGNGRGHRRPSDDEMLLMELRNLEFRFGRIDKSKLSSDVKKKLNDLFQRAPTWDDAYEIESQIAMLLTGDWLHQEITARLREALERKAPDADALQSEYDAFLKSEKKEPTVADEVLRSLLLQVLENINWQKKLKHLARKIRLTATRRTLCFVVWALLLVLWPYFVWAPAFIWVHFGLYTALTFGLLGALFSRLINLQSSNLKLEELHNAQGPGYIALRACIGVCGAVIVYFFLQSELVQSVLFPVFKKLGEDVKSVGDGNLFQISNLARLIIWSFIAGFSELLVPSILSTTEGQLGVAVSARPATPGS